MRMGQDNYVEQTELEDDGRAQCRFCFETGNADSMIAPCLCAGSIKYVHMGCLDEWRAQESIPRAFTHCPSCRLQYLTDCPPESPRQARRALWRFRFFVARDMGVLFVSVQLIIAGIAKLIHMLDVGNQIPQLFPKEWAARNATVLAVGPYYCSGAIMFFALIGLIALICGTQNLASAITRPRTQNLDLCFCCDPRSCACVCDGARVCDAFSNAHACSECGTCGTCGTCASSDTAAACGALLLVMILVLVVLGVFVAIFFGTVILQQVIEKHMSLLARRAEAQRIVVRDLRHVDPAVIRLLGTSPHLVHEGIAGDSTSASDTSPLLAA